MSMPDSECNIFPCDNFSLHDGTTQPDVSSINSTHNSNTLPSNLNPLAISYINCRENCPTRQSELNLHKGVRTDIKNRVKTVMNVVGGAKLNVSIISFMSFILVLCSYIMNGISINNNLPEGGLYLEDANRLLRKIRIKNINRVIIGTLNINSLSSKFEQLKLIIGNYLDILVIQETKLHPSFSNEQFMITGYTKPYRLDRNRNGGGAIIYVREDIPSKELKKHHFTRNIEGLFLEGNLRKTKLLFFGTYHSTHPEYGLSDTDYFEQVGLALDVYSNYEKFLLAGDFNVEEEERCLKEFLFEYNAKNLVKGKTCFKSIDKPSCIDLFLTNSYQNFQNTTTVSTGLSDFHKMSVTVMKTTFPKAKPKVIQYRDYKHFVIGNFRLELRFKLRNEIVENYGKFEDIFLGILGKHAPLKKKVLRANEKPYMTKTLKAIMRRSALQNKYYRGRTPESEKAFKKQRNYTTKLIKKEKKKYFSSINMTNYTDNKKFLNTVKPLLSNYNGGSKKIILIEDDKIISNDEEVAKTLNLFFENSVKSLNLTENNALLNYTNPVEIALKKLENQPSIVDIKNKVTVEAKFSFSKVKISNIKTEINNLDTNKAGTFSNVSAKQLQQVEDVIAEPLMHIWNKEIIENKKFPGMYLKTKL